MLTPSEEDQLRSFITKSIDFSKRKIQNAAPGIDDHDYVILKQLTDSNLFLQAGSGAIKRPVQDKLRERVSVKDFGALGNNIHDDTLNIQKGIDYLRSVGGGTLWVPRGVYKLTLPISIYSNIEMLGESYAVVKDPLPATVLNAFHDGPILIQGEDPVTAFKLGTIAFFGTGNSGSCGVWFNTTASSCTFRDLFFNNFGDWAIYIFYGADGEFQNLFAQNSLLVRSGRTIHAGVFDIGVADAEWSHVGATASVTGTGNFGDGKICGIVNRGFNSRMRGVVGHFSQVGIAIDGSFVTVENCRTDNNQGYGWEIGGFHGTYGLNSSFGDSQHGDGAFSAFRINGYLLRFIANSVRNYEGAAVQSLHGYEDISTSSGADVTGNFYLFNTAYPIRGNKYEISTPGTVKSWADFNGTVFEVYKEIAMTRFISKGDTPTIFPGDKAGIGGIASVIGNDLTGTMTITTGTGVPFGQIRLALLIYNQPFTTIPLPFFTPVNLAAGLLTPIYTRQDTQTLAYIEIVSHDVVDSTEYMWNYFFMQ